MTRFGDILPLWQIENMFGNFIWYLAHICKPTLAIFECYWTFLVEANVQTFNEYCGHLVTLGQSLVACFGKLETSLSTARYSRIPHRASG